MKKEKDLLGCGFGIYFDTSTGDKLIKVASEFGDKFEYVDSEDKRKLKHIFIEKRKQ